MPLRKTNMFRWLAVSCVIFAVGLGTARRVANPRIAMCLYTDEFSEVMPGLRLHALPLWNLNADVRNNFFKSAMYSPHGLGDTGFYYLASGALGLLRLPISDRNLWLTGAMTNALLVMVAAWFSYRVARSAAMAYAVVIILALAPVYIFASQTGFARYSFVPLLQLLTLVLAWQAVKGNVRLSRILLPLVALILSLTDGFYFGAVLVAFLFLLHSGPLVQRLKATLRASTFWWTCAAIALGLSIDLAGARIAVAHDTTLTLFGYISARSGYAGVLSAHELLAIWLRALQLYVPVVGAVAVIPAWLWAARHSWSDPVAGALAAWFAVASVGVIRFFSNFSAFPTAVIWALSAYSLALPAFMLVAWAFGRLSRSSEPVMRMAAGGLFLAVAIPLAAQTLRDRYDIALTVRAPSYVELKDRCAVVKAASAFVREHATPNTSVVQLTNDMRLGVMGEFYYGLSYVGNNRTGERNRLLDNGELALGRPYSPRELADLYGVSQFSYYVEFDPPDRVAGDAVRELEGDGARAVLEIRDGDRLIGRVFSFDDRLSSVMRVEDAAERWNRHAHLSKLFGQSLAGTSYHFGYAWPEPPDHPKAPTAGPGRRLDRPTR